MFTSKYSCFAIKPTGRLVNIAYCKHQNRASIFVKYSKMITQQHHDTNRIFFRSFFARLPFWVVLCFSCFFVQAQSFYVVRTSVGHHMGSGFSAGSGMYKAHQVVGQSVASPMISVGPYSMVQGFVQPLYSDGNLIDDRVWGIEFITYPNPVLRTLFIDINRDINIPIRVSISDLHGRSVFRKSFVPGSKFEIDVSFLAAGSYLLQARIGTRNIVKRFSKRTVF